MRLDEVPQLLREVDRLLARKYRTSTLRNYRDPMSEIVFILLSAQTEEYNYVRTYGALRRRFHSWLDILRAGEERVYRTISFGGLGRKKANQLIRLLGEVRERYGSFSLRELRTLSDQDAEASLTLLPGVGLKTARC